MKGWFNDITRALRCGSLPTTFIQQYRQAIASDFIRKVTETFATRIFMTGVGLLTSVMIARALGPEGRGLLAAATTVGAIGVQFGNIGLHASNTYYVAQNRDLLPTLLSNSLFISFGLGGLGAVSIWGIMFLLPNIAPVQGLLLLFSLAYIPFGLAYLLLQNLLLGIQQVSDYNKVGRTTALVGAGVVGLLILGKKISPETISGVGLLSAIASTIWVAFKLYKYIQKVSFPSRNWLKKTFSYGIKAYLAALFSFMVIRFDILMLQHMLGAEQTGFYSVAAGLVEKIYMLPVAIGTILFPKLSSLTNNKEKWLFVKKIISPIFIIVIGSITIAYFCVKPFISILYGSEFLPAVPAFASLLPGLGFLSMNIVFMNYFASIGMPSITVYSPGVAMIANILINMQLIPNLGIIGASISSDIAYGLMLILSMFFIYKGGTNSER